MLFLNNVPLVELISPLRIELKIAAFWAFAKLMFPLMAQFTNIRFKHGFDKSPDIFILP